MACTHAYLYYKRGDTFDKLIAIPDIFADGYFSGWTITSQIRTVRYQQLIGTFTCTWVDATTTRLLTIHHDADGTDSWPVGEAELDVQFTSPSGEVISTSTLAVTILDDVTRPDTV